jgi:hypothetical protein
MVGMQQNLTDLRMVGRLSLERHSQSIWPLHWMMPVVTIVIVRSKKSEKRMKNYKQQTKHDNHQLYPSVVLNHAKQFHNTNITTHLLRWRD